MNGTVRSCTNYMNIYTESLSNQVVGGIVGGNWNGGIIEDCENYGTIYAKTTTTNYMFVAGIVGYNEYSEVKGCTNYGNISAWVSGDQYNLNHVVAGIVGYNYSSIEECINRGNISIDGEDIGVAAGISGSRQSGDNYIANCVNYGEIQNTVTGRAVTAGIVAQLYGEVSNCQNYGSVISTSSNTNSLTAGIVCQAYGGPISNCSNYSEQITGVAGTIDGIKASGTAEVENCESVELNS